jgi:chitinase
MASPIQAALFKPKKGESVKLINVNNEDYVRGFMIPDDADPSVQPPTYTQGGNPVTVDHDAFFILMADMEMEVEFVFNKAIFCTDGSFYFKLWQVN